MVKVLLKIKKNSDLRRISLEEIPTYTTLSQLLHDLFPETKTDFIIKYIDDENDLITVTSDREISEAWDYTVSISTSTSPLLRLVIEEKQEENPQSTPLIIDNSCKGESKCFKKKSAHNATCDVCDNRIEGIRYKCKNCPDYDLCESCEPNKEIVHDDTHSFEQIMFPTWPRQFFGHRRGGFGGHHWRGHKDQESDTNEHSPFKGYPHPHHKESGDNFGSFGGRPHWKNWGNWHNRSHFGKWGGSESLNPHNNCKGPKYMSRFITDVTIESGTIFKPNTTFIKIWKLRNNGDVAWPENTRLVHVSGDSMSSVEAVVVPSLQPDEEVDVAVEMISPERTGRYVSNYRLVTPEGIRFGHRVWADITVCDPNEEVEIEQKNVDEVLEKQLMALETMQFVNKDLNIELLKKYNGDVLATVNELLSQCGKTAK